MFVDRPELMKAAPYIAIAALALVLLYVLWRWDKSQGAMDMERVEYADTIATVRFDFANAMFNSAQDKATINELTRQLDSAKHVRQPLNLVIHESQQAFADSSVDAMQRLHWSDPE